MLDINLFREDKGKNPEIIRESQRRRFADVEIVDQAIQLDLDWHKVKFELVKLDSDLNAINKEVSNLKRASRRDGWCYMSKSWVLCCCWTNGDQMVQDVKCWCMASDG